MKVFIAQSDIEELYSQMPNSRVREILILANQRLVHHTVHKYFYDGKVEYDDLASRGTLGLIKAVDTYDVSRGVAFSTFGIMCIHHEICKMFRDDVPKFDTVSYEECIYPNQESSLDFEDVLLVSDPEEDPGYITIRNDTLDRVSRELKHLTDRERQSLVLWLGLDGHGRRTQAQIAKKLHTSQAQVSRNCQRAIKHLRELIGIE